MRVVSVHSPQSLSTIYDLSWMALKTEWWKFVFLVQTISWKDVRINRKLRCLAFTFFDKIDTKGRKYSARCFCWRLLLFVFFLFFFIYLFIYLFFYWVVSRVLSRNVVTKRLRSTAVVLFDWVVFRLRKRKKYALLFLLDRFDSILQISHMLKYVLKRCYPWAYS